MIAPTPQWMSCKAGRALLLSGVLSVPSAGVAKQASALQDLRVMLASTIDKRQDTGDDTRIRHLEPAAIRSTDGRADRKGNKLTLHFSNGKSHTYITKGDCESLMGECQGYTLLALASPANFFLVHEWFYERTGCLIVDSRTGSETELPDVPYLSPDGGRLLVVSGTDGGGGYWPLQIWRRRGDTAFVEWKQSEAPSKSPTTVSALQWDSNDKIDLKMVSGSRVQPPPSGFTPSRWSATLSLTSRGWSMNVIAEP